MAKLYTKQTWVDEVLAAAAAYQVKNDGGTIVYNTAAIDQVTAVVQAGSDVNATRMNHIEDGLDAVDTLLDDHIQRPTIARYSTTAEQVIPDSSITIIDFETKNTDPDDLVTTGASWHFTAPASGYYAVTAMVAFAITTAWLESEYAQLYLFIDGSESNSVDMRFGYGAGAYVFLTLSGCEVVYLAANSTLDLRLYQTSGSGLALAEFAGINHVSIWKI
jgi:hypothetical protein